MIKDHHIVLDRAVNRLQIRLDELKVWRSGRPRVGRIPHRDVETLPRGFTDTPKAGEPGRLCWHFNVCEVDSPKKQTNPPPHPHTYTRAPGQGLSRSPLGSPTWRRVKAHNVLNESVNE